MMWCKLNKLEREEVKSEGASMESKGNESE